MTTVLKAWAYLFATVCVAFFLVFSFAPELLFAKNINEYKDTISNSQPSTAANHTLAFKLGTTISPGAYLEVTMPTGFEVLSPTSTFSADRNIELYVNGVLRDSGSTLGVSTDLVEVFSGSPGQIKYTLNSTAGISSGSNLEMRIGNHTSQSIQPGFEYSTSTGTTTTPGDIKPVINAPTIGTKEVKVEIYDGGLVANAGLLIAMVDQVGVGPVDTTELVPPVRFNGAPSGTVSGVSLNVEIFVETNELAVCKYDTVPGTDYFVMPNQFPNTGLIYHTDVVAISPETTNSFYIRCIDDEGNYNIDDYLLQFFVTALPTGSSTTDGTTDGDGSGTGDAGGGTGTGDGSGDNTGSGGGTSSGGSGSSGGGGGGGGGTGGNTGSTAGGGFESTDGPYRSGDGRVIISGYAFPQSTVYALVDGNATENVKANSSGAYSITIDEIYKGVYTFGVYAVDRANTKSSTFSTSFTVIGARTSALSNINLSPTVKATPDPVDPGAALTLSGYAMPNAVVSIENEKDKSTVSRQAFSATADGNGAWSVNVDTGNFSNGTYKARAKSTKDGIAGNFSNYTLYGVGENATSALNPDLNRDGKVNLTDFSILLYWWNTDGGNSNPPADINSDGKVSLTDFSILLFNWTG